MKKYESLYNFFNGKSKEEVDNAIEKLSYSEKELLKLRFSDNFDNKYKRNFYYIINKIRVILNNKDVCYSNGKKIKTLYQIFREEKKEDVDYVFSLLPDYDKKLIYSRYGMDFSNPDTSDWDNSNSNKLCGVIYKMSKLLNDLKNKKEIRVRKYPILTLYQIFDEYPKKAVDKVVSELDDYWKHVIFVRYGSDLEKIDTSNWSEEYRYLFYKRLLPKMRNKLRNDYIKTNRDLTRYIKINNPNPRIKELIEEKRILLDYNYNILLDKFTKEEILIYILVVNMDNSYNLYDLEVYFELDGKYILNIAKKVLNEMIKVKTLIKK